MSSTHTLHDRKPASAARLRANRKNAEKSTGPRTKAGKLRSSQNARTHGAYAAFTLSTHEAARDFLCFRLALQRDFGATHFAEYAIVERIIIAQWELRRCADAELYVHQRGTEASATIRDDAWKLAAQLERVGSMEMRVADELLEALRDLAEHRRHHAPLCVPCPQILCRLDAARRILRRLNNRKATQPALPA